MNWYESIARKRERLVIGLMSGTSMDGIDAALVKITGSGTGCGTELLDFLCIPYDEFISEELRSVNHGFSLGRLSDLNFLIGESFSEAASKLMRKNSLSSSDVDLIGSHGQTVYHNPPSAGNLHSSTMQLGESDVIAERTGVTTVSDFRTRDMASGGEGAPLIPYVDFLLFSSDGRTRIAQNIGGISNLTVVTESVDDVTAFDTGPGNALIDGVVGIHTAREISYDKSGNIASSGSVDRQLLERLMDNRYFRIPPPKSTGREVFGDELAGVLYEVVRTGKLSFEDLVSTLTQFTADTIYHSYKYFVFPVHDIDEVILSGGGARNGEIVKRLKQHMAEIRVSLSDEYGIPAEAKEALGFAVLANETIMGNPGNLPGVTGAVNASPVGKISVCK